MTDILAWISIILSAISITLAILAIIFGWITFRNANRMQIESSYLLSQVSQKVEVISERTSRQLDKAWDYVTNRQGNQIEGNEQIKKEIERMKKQVIDEAREEANALIKNAGLDKQIAKSTVDKLNNIVGKVTEKSTEIGNISLFLERYGMVEQEVKAFVKSLGLVINKESNLSKLLRACQQRTPPLLPPPLFEDITKLTEVRNKIVHGNIDFSYNDLMEHTRSAAYIYGYLHAKFEKIKIDQMNYFLKKSRSAS
jgi:hypothetical protein